MSRHQPPLPPGLPPKSAADTYRPGSGSIPNRDRRDDRQPMFYFNGVQTGYNENYRPSNNSYAPAYDHPRDGRDNSYRPRDVGYDAPGYAPPRRDSGGYGQSMNSDYRSRGLDVYRPQDSSYDQKNNRSHPPLRPAHEVYPPPLQSNFTFRHEAPQSIDFRATDNHRPRSPHQRHRVQHNNNAYRGNNAQQGGQRGGYGYRGRAGPRLASERDFLKGNRAPTPELMAGMQEDTDGPRYKRFEDLSDSDEAEMDISEDEQDEDAGQPKKKQARTGKKAADGDSAPKWSNPDPYSVLPPPDVEPKKGKDIVKLLHKAKIDPVPGSSTKADAEPEDFIAFDFGDDEDDQESVDSRSQGPGVAGAPTGPRSFSHRDTIQKSQMGGVNSSRPALPPDIANLVDLTSSPTAGSRKNNASNGTKKPASQNSANTVDLTADSNLGSRKRNIRDEIKETPTLRDAMRDGPRVMQAPDINVSMKGKPRPVNGEILKAWRASHSLPQTPWIGIDHSDTANMGLWLHKEIRDFYEFVKPRGFEEFIRSKLIEDLQIRVRKEWPDVSVLTFGSFPAGLYLPTADMDIVCVSRQYLNGGRKEFCTTRKTLFQFSNWVQRQRLALEGSVECIQGAKVPLVKYVDKVTGLKVDISFENTTGLAANKTFQDWKTQYPAMPVLVTVVKHLLAMRGLNEPVNGGIGGFSVICLVISLLQLMPQVQSRTMIPEHHFGEILMEFLDLYGNQFDVITTGIQFDPPGYFRKSDNQSVYRPRAQNQSKFCILDPNNAENDIAGGSSNTDSIRAAFSRAYDSLQKRMGTLQHSKNRSMESILGSILGGNYESFRLQREHLAHLHETLYGPITD